MFKFFSKNLTLLSFLFIPILFLWHPNWLGILGNQPNWILIWLLPWSMIYGSINGCVFGLFLGLILDAISVGIGVTQIPGLMICGLWFGRISIHSNFVIGHFRYGLICAIGSFLCSTLYLLQILVKTFSENDFLFLNSGIKSIFAEVFLTSLFAPLVCSQLLRVFKRSKKKIFY